MPAVEDAKIELWRKNMSGEGMTINFEEEIEHFKPSLEVEEVGEAIVKSDLTDMSDIMMELLKHMKE